MLNILMYSRKDKPNIAGIVHASRINIVYLLRNVSGERKAGLLLFAFPVVMHQESDNRKRSKSDCMPDITSWASQIPNSVNSAEVEFYQVIIFYDYQYLTRLTLAHMSGICNYSG